MSLIPVNGTPLPYYFLVVTPGGVALLASEILRDCDTRVCNKECPSDLIILDILDFDLILSIDWLFRYYAKVDCR